MGLNHFIAIILAGILSAIMYFSYKKTMDLFSPLVFFSFFQFLRYVPSLFSMNNMTDLIPNKSILRFFIIELTAIISIYFGYIVYKKYNADSYKYELVTDAKRPPQLRQALIIILFFIGFSERLRVIESSGGLAYVINNPHLAYLRSTAGSGYSGLLTSLMTVAIIMQIKMISETPAFKSIRRTIYMLIFLAMILLSAASYLIFSRRSPALEMLMVSCFAYNYLFKRITISDIIKPKSIVLISIVVIIIVIMPQFRNGKGVNSVSINQINIFREFSYFERDIKCFDFFSRNEKWIGRSYANLITAPIPSALFADKPPIDDGLYLYNMLMGYDFIPPKPISQLPFYNSLPFSTQGIMFANFGIIGVSVGEMIMGILYCRYYKMLMEIGGVYRVIVYQLIIYQLELSTLSIIQTFIPYFSAYLVCRIIEGKPKVRRVEVV